VSNSLKLLGHCYQPLTLNIIESPGLLEREGLSVIWVVKEQFLKEFDFQI